jgi:hypothetical protein
MGPQTVLPPPTSRAWIKAEREHHDVVMRFRDLVRCFAETNWQREPAPGRWSAAALVWHVCQSYELGAHAARGGSSMVLRSPALLAFLSRNLLLPVMLATRTFPREAPAPREVRPDLPSVSDFTVETALRRLEHASADALSALTAPDAAPFTHAYFGTLSPRHTLRLLSAHTRHHTQGLEQRLR